MSKFQLFSFAMSSVFRVCCNLNSKFFLSSQIEFFSRIKFWVLRLFTNFFFFLVLLQIEFLSFFSTPYFLFHFFNFKYFHCTHCWSLRAHAGKYPPASLGPFSIPDPAVYDRVCSLFTEKISCLLSLSCSWDWQQYFLLCTP